MSGARLRAVTFDATGTLLVPRALGRDYAAVLARHGIRIEAEIVERLLRDVLDERRVIADPFRDPYASHPGGSRGYWTDVVERLLALAGLPAPSPFAVVELWDRFRRAEAWRVLPGVPSVLAELADLGLRLGVIANWDERLEEVLEAVGLLQYFVVVVRSSEVGWAKPHRAIFREALRRLGVDARETLHVGDDALRDVEGARAAGMHAQLVGDPNAPLAGVLERVARTRVSERGGR